MQKPLKLLLLATGRDRLQVSAEDFGKVGDEASDAIVGVSVAIPTPVLVPRQLLVDLRRCLRLP